jgi:hypothetical protein
MTSAIETLRRAVLDNPEDRLAVRALAEALYESGDFMTYFGALRHAVKLWLPCWHARETMRAAALISEFEGFREFVMDQLRAKLKIGRHAEVFQVLIPGSLSKRFERRTNIVAPARYTVHCAARFVIRCWALWRNGPGYDLKIFPGDIRN